MDGDNPAASLGGSTYPSSLTKLAIGCLLMVLAVMFIVYFIVPLTKPSKNKPPTFDTNTKDPKKISTAIVDNTKDPKKTSTAIVDNAKDPKKTSTAILDVTEDPHGFHPGTRLVSPDGVYSFSINVSGGGLLTMHKNGKLGWSKHPVYHKSTDPVTLYLNQDGTFKVKTASGTVLLDQMHNGAKSNHTHFTKSSMVMQNDGNLVVYSSIGHQERIAVWASGTTANYWANALK